jgi:hypothetical protein
MINDTCKCGAVFVIQQHYESDERNQHDRWLSAHAPCRTAPVYVHPPYYYPVTPTYPTLPYITCTADVQEWRE